MTRAGLPHSETPGSTLPCQLPRAYRRLVRPSSALDAKASTMCPYQLAQHKPPTHTTNLIACTSSPNRDTKLIKTPTTKQSSHYKHTPHPSSSPSKQKKKKERVCLLASTIDRSRTKKPNQPPPDNSQSGRSDASDTQQRATHMCFKPM